MFTLIDPSPTHLLLRLQLELILLIPLFPDLSLALPLRIFLNFPPKMADMEAASADVEQL